MHYKPDAAQAFASVEYIMRDVDWDGDTLHAFHRRVLVLRGGVPAHVSRLIYGSYRKPRELLWLLGVLIYLCLMAEAFFGYLLPWARCPTGARSDRQSFAAIPSLVPTWRLWIRGDYVVSDATLNRFFAFHRDRDPAGAAGLGLCAPGWPCSCRVRAASDVGNARLFQRSRGGVR